MGQLREVRINAHLLPSFLLILGEQMLDGIMEHVRNMHKII